MTPRSKKAEELSFIKKVWITGSIFAFIIILILLLKATFGVLLLILAGTLISVFFRGLSDLIKHQTGWREGACLAISIIGTLVIVFLLFWLLGAKVQSQMAQLTETLPSTLENAKNQLNQTYIGQKIVRQVSSPESQRKAESFVQIFFTNTFGVLGDIYVVLFIGIFFTVSPNIYKRGIVQIIPVKGKRKADQIFIKLGENLRKWLKGQLFAMLMVLLLTSTGLLIIGVPMWLALGIIAGLLNFIPNFGPLIALIPAVLVGLMQSPTMAFWVAGLYISVQVLESNFITPMVQQRLISVPPAMILIAQLLMAPLTGGWGLVLATPMLVIVTVLVKELYISRQ